jgi:DNA-binding MarR family transcriptional regulator
MNKENIRTLIREYVEVSNFINKKTRELAEDTTNEHQLTYEQHVILRMLDQSPGMSPVEIAANLDINKSGVTIRINRLVSKGLVEKRKKDNRSFGLFITDTGKQYSRRGDDKLENMVIQWVENIGESEMAEFMNTYKKIYKYMAETSENE